MKPRRSLDLTTGPVLSKLLQFVLPILFSNLLQQLYNVADKIVVGQFAENGKIALAAVGAAAPACNLLVNLLAGLSLGSNIVCANLKGARKTKELSETMHTAVLMSFGVGLILCVLGLVFSSPLLRAMSTPESTLDMSVLYMRIYFCGIPFSMVYNFGAGILRSHGDAKRPMSILALAGIVNVALNLVFVIVFNMGAGGVALATAVAQAISAIWVLLILFDPKDEYKLQFKSLRLVKKYAFDILRNGIPCCMNTFVFSISNVLVASSVNALGDTVLAGKVAAGSITDLLYLILAAFNSACISFTGQCCGARKYRRIDQMLLTSCITCVAIMTAINLPVTIFPEAVLSLFNRDPEVIAAGIPSLMIIGWGYLIFAISEIFLGTLRGMGKNNAPTVINIFCACGIRLAWIYGVYRPFLTPGIPNLYICYPISYVIGVVSLGIYLLHCRKQLFRHAEDDTKTATA